MSKLFLVNRLFPILITPFILGSISLSAMAQDRFALQPTAHDNLAIFGPKGERVADLEVPTISRTITVGSTSFQISYGRDANDLLTAIVAPSSSQPQDLHFSVLNKSVDADKQAVVTLTFPNDSHVSIDPGYIGSVVINSQSVKRHNLADDSYVPHATRSSALAPRTSMDLQPRDLPPASPHPTKPVASAPASAPIKQVASNTSAPSTPVRDTSSSDDTASTPPPSDQKLFWSEPITPLHGTPTPVASNEVKLVDVHGDVTVTTPDGDEKTGTNGMVVPAGSKVSTGDDSSAAVFMGGVNSARFLPKSEAAITQNMEGKVRHTDINLTKGSVFSRVGRRPGESQDYKVSTPQGVAAARGTEYAVGIIFIGGLPQTISFVKESEVQFTDANGHTTLIAPHNGDVAVGSTGAVPIEVEKGVLLSMLNTLQKFNTTMQALATALKNDPSSVSAADKAYYNKNKGEITTATQLYDVITQTTVQLFGANPTGTTVKNNGTSTTTSKTTFEGNSVIVSDTTVDNATGATLKTVVTTTTTNPDGTYTVTIVTTDADGNTTTSVQTTNPRPSSGTLNAVLNEFSGPPSLTPH